MQFIKSGFWVYLLTVALLALGTLYIVYRRDHPRFALDKLITIQSKYAFLNTDPCLNQIVGEPVIPNNDSYIKVNIICPNGKISANVIRMSTLPPLTTLYDVATLIAKVNNFPITLNNGNQHSSVTKMGAIENNQDKYWRVYSNDQLITSPLDNTLAEPKSRIEFKYE